MATPNPRTDRRALAARLAPPSAEDLRAARKALGLTQRGLAAALGVGHGTVSGWETGKKSPQADSLRRLVELLDPSAAALGVGHGPGAARALTVLGGIGALAELAEKLRIGGRLQGSVVANIRSVAQKIAVPRLDQLRTRIPPR